MPLDLDAAADWLAKVRGDLRMTEFALLASPPLGDQACFHAQQAAEKALKSVLVAHQTPFPFTHNLAVLVDLVRTLAPEVQKFAPFAVALSRYASISRYPDAFEPTLAEAQEATDYAIAISDWAADILAKLAVDNPA